MFSFEKILNSKINLKTRLNLFDIESKQIVRIIKMLIKKPFF
jgi:hypothetical protein